MTRKEPSVRIAIAVAVLVTLLGSATAIAGGTGHTSSAQRLPGTLAFSAGINGKRYQVFLMRPDGSTVQATHRAIRRDDPGFAGWSPDGSRFAVVGDNGLYVVSVDDLSEIRVSGLSNGVSAQSLAWAPDGRRLLYDDAGVLYLVNADGSGGLVRLPRSNGGGSWSPDGRRIVYTGYDAAHRPVALVADTVGNVRARQLWPAPGHALKKGCGFQYWPSWSPAGGEIALAVACWPRTKYGPIAPLGGWVSTIRPDGTGFRFRHRGFLGPWSPDGRTLVVYPGSGSRYLASIFVVHSGRSSSLRLPGCPNGCSNVVWMPDGRQLAYMGLGGLHLVSADGSSLTRVTRTGSMDFSVSPDGGTFALATDRGRKAGWYRQMDVVRADGSGQRVIAQSKTATYWGPRWRPR
jgi:dipeptidyl aminopeptidase/acylaminoacyl peptidase